MSSPSMTHMEKRVDETHKADWHNVAGISSLISLLLPVLSEFEGVGEEFVMGIGGAGAASGAANGSGVCCDANSPPAKAACIGSSEAACVSNIGSVTTSSSPNPSNAVPKAAAIGSPVETSTLAGERLEEVDCR